jgi:hypothetical protein
MKLHRLIKRSLSIFILFGSLLAQANDTLDLFVSPVGLLTGSRIGGSIYLTDKISLGVEYSNINFSYKSNFVNWFLGDSVDHPSSGSFYSGSGWSYGLRGIYSFHPEKHDSIILITKILKEDVQFNGNENRSGTMGLLGLGEHLKWSSSFFMRAYVGFGGYLGSYKDVIGSQTVSSNSGFLFGDIELGFGF